MGVYNPTSQTFPNDVVSIDSSSATTYAEILHSLGSMNYLLKELYLKTGTQQILQPMLFHKFDANGNIREKPTVPTLDPYQDQTALFIKFGSNDYVLDGKMTIDFTLLANETVFFYLYVKPLGQNTILDMVHPVKDFLDEFGFYSDYVDKLPTSS